MRKARSDSTLMKLPDATRQAIFALERDEGLSIQDMVARLSMPEDEGGFEIETSHSALARFLRAMRTEAFIGRLRSGRDRVEAVTAELAGSAEVDADPLIVEAVKEYTLDLLASNDVDASALSSLLKGLASQRRLEIAQDQLELDKRKLAILEAKAAAFDKIKDESEDDNLTPAEKLERIRKGLKI